MRALLVASLLFDAAFVMGCGADDQPPLTDATSLQCPTPGDLPFRLPSHGFQRSANATIAKEQTRIKDEAPNTLGVPGGAVADIYLADSEMPSAQPIKYEGMKARTGASQGIFSKSLAGENVSLWYYDASASMWNMLDRGTTDDNGMYSFAAGGFVAPNATPVYSLLEADGTCSTQYNYLLPTGSKFVVMDIDGTLTTDDNELIMQVSDPNHVPAMMPGASALAKAWAAKGYPIVYLTARSHVFDTETRVWLDMLDFPKGALITENGGSSADVYKTLWLRRMITSFGWTPYAAYGNASTDVTAYANVNIPLDHTFIVGPLAGMNGTTPIANMDYTDHINTFVAAQPDNH